MKLQYKIALFTTVILIIVIEIIGGLSYRQMESALKYQMGKNAMDMAVAIAQMDVVKNNIGSPSGHVRIQQAVETIRLKTHVQFIIVMDMNGKIYSHPLIENIGKKYSEEDNKAVLTAGESYTSEGKGSLGPSIKAFVPVYQGGEQVGAVCTGVLTGWVRQELYSSARKFVPFLIIGLMLGIAGAVLLSYNIKRTIFGLEPGEIAMLLSEREAIFHSVTEGIIAVDFQGRLTFFNQAAKDMLKLNDKDKGTALFNHQDSIKEVLGSGRPIYNREMKIRPGITMLCNYYPLKQMNDKVTGVVVSLRDMTTVKHLAEELTGIKKLTWALRAQNHEFMNKLHTISGLIQLEEYDHAVQYISETVKTRQDMMSILTNRIKDPVVAGLMLAKYNKVAESRVTMELDPESVLRHIPEDTSADEIGSILGNLIENALEALIGREDGKIGVKIFEDEDNLIIEVWDNGPGISESIRDSIYEKGTTTKEGPRGFGMSIVKRIVDEAGGTINFSCDNGTKWHVSIPLDRRAENDKDNDN